MDIKIFQFNGCNKCFYETLLLKLEENMNIEFISNPKDWKVESMDVAVISGYLLYPGEEWILCDSSVKRYTKYRVKT